jgi:hypothetical protein
LLLLLLNFYYYYDTNIIVVVGTTFLALARMKQGFSNSCSVSPPQGFVVARKNSETAQTPMPRA